MSTELQIKFAIADDHKIFRDGIKMALNGKPHLKLAWEAADGKEMMHKLTIKRPDLLLLDIRMPELDGSMHYNSFAKSMRILRLLC
jgi:DNA-binding NarL/FixJ family response regulator